MAPVADRPVGFALGLALTLRRSLAFGLAVRLGDGIGLVRDWAASLLRTSENVGRLAEAPGGTALGPRRLAARFGTLGRVGFAAGFGRGAGLTGGLAEGLERTRLETGGFATAGGGLGRTTRCKAAFRSRSTAAWLAPVDLAAGLAEDFGGVDAGRGLRLVPVRMERGVEGARLATSGAERFPGDMGRVNRTAERVAGTVGRVILGVERIDGATRRVDLAAERLTEGVGRVTGGAERVTGGVERGLLTIERAGRGVGLGGSARGRRALGWARALAAATLAPLSDADRFGLCAIAGGVEQSRTPTRTVPRAVLREIVASRERRFGSIIACSLVGTTSLTDF